jgi:hypothetical protein
MRLILTGFAVAACLAICAGSTSAAEFKGVWVTSSASVDTSSAKAMVDGIVRPGMTDEQKVLAIFNWYRRVVYPHAYLLSDRRDVLRQINSYGNTLCGSHAANLGWLMRAAGFKTRCVYIREGGHTFIDVWYGDNWHAVDPETDFAVWSRAEPRQLINMDDLKADPALLDNAEAEGRAKPWLFKAMKFPWTTREKMAAYCDDPRTKCDKSAMQWSSSVLKGESIKDYFVEGVKTVKYSEDNEPYGGRVSDPDLMHFDLKPGETLVRRWDNEGKDKYIRGAGFGGYPAHLLYGGGADENDEEVFPWVEPYRKDSYGIPELPVDRCYRYSGNGHLTWTVDAAALAKGPGTRLENLVFDDKAGVIRPVEAGKPGRLFIPIRSAYALVCGEIRGTWLRGGEGDTVKVGLTAEKDGFRQVWEARATGEHEATASLGPEINGRFDYEIQAQMTAKADLSGTGLRRLTVDHTFVNNWLALPCLAPGENTIRVRFDNPDATKDAVLWIQYEWDEGEGWTRHRIEKRRVTSSPFEFVLKAEGPKFPRMKALTLSVTAAE